MDVWQAFREHCTRLHILGLFVVLLIAFYLRASSLAFGLPSLNDQDELVFQMGAVRLLTTPTLNPKWFGHPGTTTIYGLALVDIGTYLFGHLVGWWHNAKGFVDAFFANPTLVILPGRAMILTFGLWVVALTYRLGARLFTPAAGLCAALVVAVSPLQVAYSQIIRSDMMATAFMLLAVLQALNVARGQGGIVSYIKCGAWIGIAVATKWPFGLAALALVGAAALRCRIEASSWQRTARHLLVGGVCSGLTLIVVSPYLLLDWQTVSANLTIEARTVHLGATGGSFLWNLQWYLTNPLFNALGIVGLFSAGLGLVCLSASRDSRFVIAPVILAFGIVLCSQNLIWPRWCLPLLPFLAIGIGAAISTGTAFLANRLSPAAAKGLSLVATLALTAPMVHASQAEGRERMNDTRQQASHWLMNHAPPGSTVLLEHFGFDLLRAPYAFRWPVGNAGCIDPLSLIQNKASLGQIESMRKGRSNVDYGTVESEKLESCQADYAIITQYDRYVAERENFPKEYQQYERLMASSETVAIFRPKPGISGGWVVRVLRIPPTAQR